GKSSFSSFSLGEKVAEGRNRLRDLFLSTHGSLGHSKKLVKKARNYDLAMRVSSPAKPRPRRTTAGGDTRAIAQHMLSRVGTPALQRAAAKPLSSNQESTEPRLTPRDYVLA